MVLAKLYHSVEQYPALDPSLTDQTVDDPNPLMIALSRSKPPASSISMSPPMPDGLAARFCCENYF